MRTHSAMNDLSFVVYFGPKESTQEIIKRWDTRYVPNRRSKSKTRPINPYY